MALCRALLGVTEAGFLPGELDTQTAADLGFKFDILQAAPISSPAGTSGTKSANVYRPFGSCLASPLALQPSSRTFCPC